MRIDSDSMRRALEMALEVGTGLTLVTVTLLYTPVFSDMFEAKGLVASGLCLWLALIWVLRFRSQITLVWAPVIYVPLSLFLMQALISAGFSRNPAHSIEDWLGYFAWGTLFVTGACLASNLSRVNRILRTIQLTSLVVAAVGILQYAGHDPLGLPARYAALRLAVSTLGNTNFVAHYLDQILPLSFVLLLSGALRPVDRGLALLCVLAGGILLFLTNSLGGWLSIAAAAFVLAASFVSQPRVWLRRVGIGILGAGLLIPVAAVILRSVPLDGNRSASDAASEAISVIQTDVIHAFERPDYSTAMRILIWKDGWRLAKDQGWVGVGPGEWGTELPAYRTSTSHRDWHGLIYARQNQAYYAHQDYLQEWGETGLLGALLLLSLLAAAATLCWRVAHAVPEIESDPPLRRALGLAGLGAVVAAGAHALISFNLRDPVAMPHLWLIVGLAAGMGLPTQQVARSTVARYVTILAVVGMTAAGTWLTSRALISDSYLARGLSHVYERQGNRAILAMRQANQWRDYDAQTQHWLGKVSLEMGRVEESIEPLERSLTLSPFSATAARLLARASIKVGNPTRAMEAAKMAIAVDPLTPDNYQLLAIAQRRMGDSDAAAATWRQALSFHPEDPKLLAALAQDLHLAGKAEDAIAVLEKALQIAPRDGVSHGNLGVYLLGEGRYKEAESHSRQAAQSDQETSAAAWSGNLIHVLILQERWSDALEEAKEAINSHPEDERLRELLRTLEERQEIQ